MQNTDYLILLDKLIDGSIIGKDTLLHYLMEDLKLCAKEAYKVMDGLLENVVLYHCPQCNWLFAEL